MKQSSRRYSIFTSCLAMVLICVLLFTGAAFPPNTLAPVEKTEAAAILPQQAAAPARADSPEDQSVTAAPSVPEAVTSDQAPDAGVASPKKVAAADTASVTENPANQQADAQEPPAPPTQAEEAQDLPTFTPASAEFVRSVLTAVLTQILTGKADRNAVIDAIERLPMPHEQAVSLAAALTDGKKGGSTIDIIKGLVEAAGDGIHLIDITLGATPSPGVYEFLGDYVKDDGTSVHVSSGVYYDEATGIVYGKDGTGLISIGFDYDAGQYLVIGAMQAWQRQFGFCRLYDTLSPLVFMDYDTVRIKFQYGEMDWMIQLWKGNYAITNGAEIGIYHKPTNRLVEFYDCAEDGELPQMAMALRKGNQILFTRGLQPHWWMTGFQLGTLYKPAQLTLDGQLIFEDPGMRDAFVKAFRQQVCPLTSSIQVEGDLVSFSWK